MRDKDIPICELDFRLAATLPDLQHDDGRAKLIYRGIPTPSSSTYIPFSRVYVRGDGQPAGDGHGTATWTFVNLSQEAVNALLSAAGFGAAEASRQVYIRTRIDTGAIARFADFAAVMWRPTDDEGKTVRENTRRPIYDEVTIKFTAVK